MYTDNNMYEVNKKIGCSSFNIHNTRLSSNSITIKKSNIILYVLLVFVVGKLIPFGNSYYQYILVIVLSIVCGCFLFSGITTKNLFLCCAVGMILLFPALVRKDSLDTFLSVAIVLICWFTFFYYSNSISLDSNQVTTIYRVIIIFSMIAILYNIITNIYFFKTLTITFVTAKDFLSSFYKNTNNYGLLLYISFSLAIAEHTKRPRRGSSILVIIIFINLILTFSRTSIIASLLFYMLYSIFTNKNKVSYYFLIVIALVIILLTVSLIYSANAITGQGLFQLDAGLGERGYIWEHAKSLIKQSPLFGYGFEDTEILYRGQWNQVHGWHNAYIGIVIRGGMLYLACYLIAVIKIIKLNMRIIKYDNHLGSVFQSFLFSYLVYSIFEEIELFSVNSLSSVVTVLVIAIPVSYYTNIRKSIRKSKSTYI